MIKAVIFDKDGVLLDSEGINLTTARMSYKAAGVILDYDDERVIVGRHPRDTVRILSKKYDFNPDIVIQKSDYYYRKYEKQAKLMPGAYELVSQLSQNFILAMATSADRFLTNRFLDRFKMKDFFRVVVAFEDCSKRKPAADIYLTALKKLKIDSNSCVVVEDSEIGVTAAKSAGIKCIAVPNQYTAGQDFSAADRVVDSFSELGVNVIAEM